MFTHNSQVLDFDAEYDRFAWRKAMKVIKLLTEMSWACVGNKSTKICMNLVKRE